MYKIGRVFEVDKDILFWQFPSTRIFCSKNKREQILLEYEQINGQSQLQKNENGSVVVSFQTFAIYYDFLWRDCNWIVFITGMANLANIGASNSMRATLKYCEQKEKGSTVFVMSTYGLLNECIINAAHVANEALKWIQRREEETKSEYLRACDRCKGSDMSTGWRHT